MNNKKHRLLLSLRPYLYIQMKNTAFLLICLGVMVANLISCSHYDEIQKSVKESTANERSHNAGDDCMSCHHDNNSDAAGTGKWWYFAGTAYTKDFRIASSAGRLELWTGFRATGTLLYRAPIDRSGNFYSSKIIDFKGGYFPVLIKDNAVSADDTVSMSSKIGPDKIFNGCNSCHGHNADGNNQRTIYFN